ncbi:MAG TPA: SMC family ATPase, partial [Trueperaceae bacterium]
LALADSVAGQQRLGSLFLDEGFGTLDPEALDSVTEVLTNLTSNGRMVGVITHVTSLTERLPARLVVEKGRLGSRLAWDY